MINILYNLAIYVPFVVTVVTTCSTACPIDGRIQRVYLGKGGFGFLILQELHHYTKTIIVSTTKSSTSKYYRCYKFISY